MFMANNNNNKILIQVPNPEDQFSTRKKKSLTCWTILVPLEVTLLVVAMFPLPLTPLPSVERVVKIAGGE